MLKKFDMWSSAILWNNLELWKKKICIIEYCGVQVKILSFVADTFGTVVLFCLFLCDKLGNLFTEITLSALNLRELYLPFVWASSKFHSWNPNPILSCTSWILAVKQPTVNSSAQSKRTCWCHVWCPYVHVQSKYHMDRSGQLADCNLATWATHRTISPTSVTKL